MKLSLSLIATAILFAPLTSKAAEDGQPLTLQQAVRLAVAQGNRTREASERHEAARARTKWARGKVGPSVDVEAHVHVWDKALETTFSLPPELVGENPPATDEDAATFRVRDQLTSQISVRATQPIAFQIFAGYKLVKLQEQLVREDVGRTHLDVVYDVVQRYIRLKQALVAAEIARASSGQVQTQLEQGQALYRVGSIARNDLLKLELAVARTEAAIIESESRVVMARSTLAVALGLPQNAPLVPAETFADPPPAFAPAVDACIAQAHQHRAELKAAGTQVDIAATSRNIARWNLAPLLAATATYQNTHGQGLIYPQHAFFVGGVLQWNLWEWGATYYDIRKSTHELGQAEAALALVRDQIVLEVTQSYEDLRVSERMLHVARKAVLQAEEAYRIDGLKFGQQLITTRDLVDSQLSLTLTKEALNQALHQWYVARTRLGQAMGEPFSTDTFQGSRS